MFLYITWSIFLQQHFVSGARKDRITIAGWTSPFTKSSLPTIESIKSLCFVVLGISLPHAALEGLQPLDIFTGPPQSSLTMTRKGIQCQPKCLVLLETLEKHMFWFIPKLVVLFMLAVPSMPLLLLPASKIDVNLPFFVIHNTSALVGCYPYYMCLMRPLLIFIFNSRIIQWSSAPYSQKSPTPSRFRRLSSHLISDWEDAWDCSGRNSRW